MSDEPLGRGSKEPGRTAGAPHPPGHRQSDGPDHPRRDVPSADPDVPQEQEDDDGT
jgi:hypothetical protein